MTKNRLKKTIKYEPVVYKDYRCEDKKRVGESRGEISAVNYVLTPSCRKPKSSTPKSEPFSQEMHLKIPLLSRGLISSNFKPGCRSSALHFFVRRTPPMVF
jgi:hypothetical protein